MTPKTQKMIIEKILNHFKKIVSEIETEENKWHFNFETDIAHLQSNINDLFNSIIILLKSDFFDNEGEI